MEENKRFSIKMKNPNPLFTKWVTEWRDEALQKNLKSYNTFNLALDSLMKYPLPLKNGRECLILKGFGQKIADMIDEKLIQSKKAKGSSSATKKDYVSKIRSGAYAIILTLYRQSLNKDYKGYLTKKEIITHGQCLCDKSFIRPDPGTYYTSWSSMSTLLNKNLVIKQGSPARYSLTKEGTLLGAELHKHDKKSDSNSTNSLHCGKANQLSKCSNNKDEMVVEIIDNEPQSSSTAALKTDNTLFLTPNSFEIILLVDSNETAGAINSEIDLLINGLVSLDVPHEIRSLKVGDFLWICRDRLNKTELILPYVIERKRFDDLASSIKDGRFHEQKFRLRQCGIENVIYLLEKYGSSSGAGLGLSVSSLYQAANNTMIHDKFTVKFTQNFNGTIEYLASMTKILTRLFSNKTLMSCSKENLTKLDLEDDFVTLMLFHDFNKNAIKRKDYSVEEMFICHLLQIKGISMQKAKSITAKYPTPRLLIDNYNKMSPENAKKLLSKIQFGNLKKNIGPILSKTIYSLYNSDNFNNPK